MSTAEADRQPSFLNHQETLARQRTRLLPALLDAQRQEGFVSKEKAGEIGAALRVPLAEVYGVIEFYSLLHTEPTGETIVRVCDSPVCSCAGSGETLRALCEHFGVRPGEASADGKYFVENVPCLGMCDHAPAALVGERPVGFADSGSVETWLKDGKIPKGIVYGEERPLTGRCGVIAPTNLEDYAAQEGFVGLRKALEMEPEEVIAEVKASGLMGRGGAAFPTGVKWEGAAGAEGRPKYVVCNADESEPGTFKDRVLLEEDPFSILEGMLIAAYAIGASQGYIYIRGEYPKAQRIFADALMAADEGGYLGEGILGTDFSFDVELRSGGGAYICGEETALFESIEGKRGYPRIKPPFPTIHGLFGKPTVINNVETFANVPLILRKGAQGYRRYGSEGSSGPRLFCLSGDVERPGLYEVTTPITLRQLIFERGGGMRDGGELKAILLGGAAGKFVTGEQLDLRLTFEDTRQAGLSLGSGAIMVFDQSRNLRQVLAELGHFFAHESCGKCYPCQLGTQRQLEILERVKEGKPLPGDVERLSDVGWTMTDASLCGLGQTAALAVLSAMQHWPELFG